MEKDAESQKFVGKEIMTQAREQFGTRVKSLSAHCPE